MNQGTNNPAINKRDINSIFKNKPKPISYVKGDIAHLSEISEDSLVNLKNSTGYPKNTANELGVNKRVESNVSKNGLNVNKIYLERQTNLGI
jgi:hypothetical protein